MPPLLIFNEQAFLVSPLDIMVFPVNITSCSRKLVEKEIQDHLKTLYPGNPEETVFDYHIYGPKHRNRKSCTAAVFASSRTLFESCQKIARPLIPGISLMSAATEEIKGDKKIVILITPGWIEAGLFEQGELLNYAACPKADTGNGPESVPEKYIKSIENLPVSPMSSFFTGAVDKEIPVFLINVGAEESEYEKTVRFLETLYSRVIAMDIRTINSRRVLKHPGIFVNTRKSLPARRKKIIFTLALLNILSLACAIRITTVETNRELSFLQEYYREQGILSGKATALEKEIEGLNSRLSGEKVTVYEAIGGLQSCLSKGWVKSLVIQGGKLILEAEGDDSLDVLGRLQSSGFFSGMTLNQASPSGTGGEVFSISGTLGGTDHGKN